MTWSMPTGSRRLDDLDRSDAASEESTTVTGRTRNCIFCGAEFTGQKRNFEHIIPAWLVQEADL
jgi:hypothetical protein